MAVTRRQFVATLGALTAAAGLGQAELAKITEAFGHGALWATDDWKNKPRVIWLHGAECTGCSTSLLGLFEDATGLAVENTTITTLAALNLAVDTTAGKNIVNDTTAGHPWAHRTLYNTAVVTGMDPDGIANGDGTIAGRVYTAVNIADVLIDFISLEYHETVMAMGGDLAYKTLGEKLADNTTPFVLVVEGAMQSASNGGYWKKAASFDATQTKPWCSVGMGDQSGENDFADLVEAFAIKGNCAAVIAIGQCATFGGYPGAIGPGLFAITDRTKFDPTKSQTGAQGAYDFLVGRGGATAAAASKVVNVPGCPVNPWWFVLTVVLWMVDVTNGTTYLASKDNDHRPNLVFDYPLHSGRCPRYSSYSQGIYAAHPGDDGCLALIGCKGPATKSLCARHGWNNQQPQNALATSLSDVLDSSADGTKKLGGYCISAGAPCMGCTEKGYPDAFSPFVVNR